jgi:WD40 repeat protein/class 3 adenylate cyclase/tRNA A-37 threonylcarbamoyl transferase component Bud32
MVLMSQPANLDSQSPGSDRAQRTGLVTLLFTDMVGSTALKQQLGDRAAAELFRKHHEVIRETLKHFPQGEEIETAGDSFLITFATPSDAVEFALLSQARLRRLREGDGSLDRIGIHLGEVVVGHDTQSRKPRDLFGIQIDTCSRVMSLAKAGQTLMTRAVFDSARQALKGEDIHEVGPLEWLNHGPYLLKGLDEPVEICEVREAGQEPSGPPMNSEKAQRQVRADEEPVLGWRPAVGQTIPNTRWALEKKLGEGGFGEVWLGRHQHTKERRVFKFCFQAERVRFLKREMTLFRVLKERVGDHANIVRLHDVILDHPPFYVEMDYVEGADLRSWCEEHGGIEAIPLETRLEIMAQAADGLQAAHEAGIIHRDIKPANILIGGKGIEPMEVRVKLTDFGIGQVESEESLKGITRAGFTQTIMSDSSSSRTGTQLYMAPELLAGKPASTRSDIYSLGVVLYQLLAGDFARPVTTDWAEAIADPLLRDDLKHCFAGNPNDRFAGAGQLAKSLRTVPDRQAALDKQRAQEAARERAAYQRGVLRTSAVAAAIVLVMASLAWYARQQALKAQRQREQAQEAARVLRRNVYVSDMNVAHEALAEHNLWLASSLVRKHLPKPGENEEDLRGFEWRYLWNLCRGDETFTFTNHNYLATCVVFSPDSRTLATASFDKTVNVFDVQSKTLLATFTGFTRLARNCLAFSPDGRVLVVTDDHGIAVFDTRVWRKPPMKVANESGLSWFSLALPVVFTPEGQGLTTAGMNGVRFWDTANWKPKPILEGKIDGAVGALAYSVNGTMLAVSDLEQIQVWDLRSATQINGSPIPFKYAAALRISPRNVLAAASYDGDVLLWDVPTGRAIKRWKPNKTVAFGLDFSPDGRTLATGGADQFIHLWDVASQEKLATFQGHMNEIWSVAFSPDGQMLASGNKDGTVKLWKAALKPSTPTLTNSRTPIWFSRDGRTLITADPMQNLQFWEMPNGRLFRTVKIPSEAPSYWSYRHRISPDGLRVAVTTTNGTVQVWKLQDVSCLATYMLDDATAPTATFSRDGRLVAASGLEHSVAKLWDTTTGQEIGRFPSTPHALAFSPDSTILAGASDEENAIRLWSVGTQRELATLRGHKWEIAQLAFSPEGKLLVSASIDNTARLWDIATGRQLFVFQGHQSGIHTVAFSPDGRTIATGSTDETVKLWNVATGQQLLTLREFQQDLGFILFSPDGNTLAAGSAIMGTTSPVHLWQAPSLGEIDRTERTQ